MKGQWKKQWTVRIQIMDPKGQPQRPRIVRCDTKKDATAVLGAVQEHLLETQKKLSQMDRFWRLTPGEFVQYKKALTLLRKKRKRHSGAARAVEFLDAVLKQQKMIDGFCWSRGARKPKVAKG